MSHQMPVPTRRGLSPAECGSSTVEPTQRGRLQLSPLRGGFRGTFWAEKGHLERAEAEETWSGVAPWLEKRLEV